MIRRILAIVQGRLLDLVNAGIDLVHGLLLIGSLDPVSRAMLDQPARSPQIRQRVQIGGMMIGWWRRWRGDTRCKQPKPQDCKQCDAQLHATHDRSLRTCAATLEENTIQGWSWRNVNRFTAEDRQCAR